MEAVVQSEGELEECLHCEAGAFMAMYPGNPTLYKGRCSNPDCAACGGTSTTKEGAAKKWNRRPDSYRKEAT